MDVLYPKQKLHTKGILLIGFEHRPDHMLDGSITWDEVDYEVEDLNNSFKAYRWLEQRSNKIESNEENLPFAVICSFEFLEADNFLLLESIRQHPQLRIVPFITVADNASRIDKVKALQNGIDDCYQLPVEWKNLRKRIEFLRKYKAELISMTGGKFDDELKFNIPFGKRIFDIVFSLSLILVFSPILVLIALLVKLSSKGSIIYRSKRVGTGYQVFDFLKFRSMVCDADAQLKKLSHLNNYDKGEDKSGNVSFVKLKNDPRITTIGKFIRKTSLDELPQLFNVLMGEMSIVGNRPLPLYEAEQLTTDEWSKRFTAPSGITGLWQVSGKNKDTMTSEERIALDLNYANEFSFWMDFRILCKTLPAMIQKEE